ncbi:MAG: Glu-tRNA(Gln) amidotransferase subunit GatE [Halobacteriales archaeon]
MAAHDYEALGLVAGLEIHQQLDTATKLFCGCPTTLRDPEGSVRRFKRFLHPTRSELGELDEAALEESRVDREFEYLAYDTTCLVEEDDEPPGRLDQEALATTLEIAQLLDMTTVDQVNVMRKLVIDGSNTSGFQRTALVARSGEIETEAGPVGIEDLMLEEESAQRVEPTESGVRYSLDRLGIPLVEIGTRPDIRSPEQAREAAERIGMLLRSTGKVKRGLGTIRQDVNVSIADGARVELKGVQQLDDIDDIVRLEVERQLALLELAEALESEDAAVAEPVEVTGVFDGTDSGVISGVLDDDGVVMAVKLAGFDGVVGREIQPDRRLGTELSDHAKRHGAGGVFHTDELPAYGVTEAEVDALCAAVDAGPDDAVAIVAAAPAVARTAIDAVAERARTAIEGVPEETRGANEDASSRYLRPLPGAARMYPETDVPPVEPAVGQVPTPELLTEKTSRYERELDLDPGLAEQVAYGDRWPEFERGVEIGVDPTLAARAVESTVTELRRDDVPVENLGARHFVGIFELVADGELTQEGVEELLALLAESPDRDPLTAAEEAGLGSAEEDAVRAVVQHVVERNAEQIEAEGMGAFSGLMGECMAELRGKAEGEVVSDLLREEIQART